MRKILLLAAAGAVLGAFPAHAAPTASDEITISASVAPECTLQDDLGSIDLGTLPINAAPGPDALKLVGTTTGSIPNVWMSCNTQATITLKSMNGGLVSAARAADPSNGISGFTNLITYRAQIDDGTYQMSLTTTGVAGESVAATGPAFHAQVTIRAQVMAAANAGRRPLSANDYEDILVLTLTAI